MATPISATTHIQNHVVSLPAPQTMATPATLPVPTLPEPYGERLETGDASLSVFAESIFLYFTIRTKFVQIRLFPRMWGIIGSSRKNAEEASPVSRRSPSGSRPGWAPATSPGSPSH